MRKVASAPREAFAEPRAVQIGKGATAAPFFFLTGEVGLPLLAALLFPALGFLRHSAYPSLHPSLRSRELPLLHGPAAASWHASEHVSALSASLLTLARDARDLQPKKLGVPLDVNTPRNRLTARSTASCRPSSFRP